MNLTIAFDREEDGRWIAALAGIPNLQPILTYGDTQEQATLRVKQLALQELAWMIEDGDITEIDNITFSFPAQMAA